MGKAIIAQAVAGGRHSIAGGGTHSGSSDIGSDIGALAGLGQLGVALTADLAFATKHADAVIDFSRPEMTLSLLATLMKTPRPLVIGTTGFAPEQLQKIHDAAKSMPIVLAPNTSLGVNMLLGLVRETARILGEEFDIEIVEMHHRNKVDAPSGTALALGKAAAEGRQVALEKAAVYQRVGDTGKREPGTIGFATLRGGDVVGEHTVMFANEGERVELSHIATNRNIFAKGALTAAEWVNGKKPGLYSMQDVLFGNRLYA